MGYDIKIVERGSRCQGEPGCTQMACPPMGTKSDFANGTTWICRVPPSKTVLWSCDRKAASVRKIRTEKSSSDRFSLSLFLGTLSLFSPIRFLDFRRVTGQRAMHLSPVPPTCSISCRVHIPLQPPNVPAPGEALLQARETSRFPPADSLFEAYHSFGPQRVVITGLKCIALTGQTWGADRRRVSRPSGSMPRSSQIRRNRIRSIVRVTVPVEPFHQIEDFPGYGHFLPVDRIIGDFAEEKTFC